MKCEEWQTLIEEYADGALDPKTAARVTAHVAVCAHCASVREKLGREREIYARYERDVEVTPVLWSSIEARIKQDSVSEPAGLLSRLREAVASQFAAPRLSPALAAALVIIAIGVTVAVMTYWNSRGGQKMTAGGGAPIQTPDGVEKNPPTPQPPIITTSPNATQVAKSGTPDQASKAGGASGQRHIASTARPTPAQLVREAELKYLTAIAMLSRDVNRNRSQLDPTMLARFDASLSEIDRTIKETRRLVRENPGDPIALQYLLAAYSKKVDVLREMTAD